MNLRLADNPDENAIREQMENAGRRLAILHGLAPLIEAVEPASDQERIVLLASRLGDVSDAYLFAHKNVEDELQRLAAAVFRFLEDDLRTAAR